MSFILKRNERIYSDYVKNVTTSYKNVIKAIVKFFEEGGYEVAQSVGCLRKKKPSGHRRIHAIANVLARKGKNEEIAAIIYFPREKSISTTTVLNRLIRLDECFDQLAIFLCGTRPAFPYIAQRVRSTLDNVQIYLFDVDTKKISSTFTSVS